MPPRPIRNWGTKQRKTLSRLFDLSAYSQAKLSLIVALLRTFAPVCVSFQAATSVLLRALTSDASRPRYGCARALF